MSMTAAGVIDEQQRIIEQFVRDAGEPIQPSTVRKRMTEQGIMLPVTTGHRVHEMRKPSKIMVYATLERLADMGRLSCYINPKTGHRFYSDGGVL